MEHLPTFLRAAKSRIFFFKSSTSQVFLFKACSTMPSSSWLVLNAAGLWEWGVVGWRKGEKKVEEILLISSCRFPFLYLSVAPLFLPHTPCLCIVFRNFSVKKTLMSRH